MLNLCVIQTCIFIIVVNDGNRQTKGVNEASAELKYPDPSGVAHELIPIRALACPRYIVLPAQAGIQGRGGEP